MYCYGGKGRAIWVQLRCKSAAPHKFPKTFHLWKNNFPALEKEISNAGNFLFLRWKTIFPPLEIFFSYLGNRKFLRWN